MELRGFFDDAIRASFRDLALRDDPVAPYLADVLTRFARAEQLYPRGETLPRLETVADVLLEIQAAWDVDGGRFRPDREVDLRRHIGDYTLFMTGIFPERVARVASAGYYIDQGKRAYRFVSEHERAASATGLRFRRLAEGFETYVAALGYARRVHFHQHPEHPFFGPHLA